MRVFNKVLQAIQNKPQNGHVIANAQNRVSLAEAYKEITKLMELKNEPRKQRFA